MLLDPYPTLNWLRDNEPVTFAGDVGAWVVSNYADVSALLRDPRLSVNRIPVMAQQMLGGDTTPIKDHLKATGDMMLIRDGSDHHRRRVLGNRGFTPSALAAWSPRVDRVIDGLLNEVTGGGFDYRSW